jgi:hypothetical protein
MKTNLPFDVDIKMKAFPFYGNYFAIAKAHGYGETQTQFDFIPIRYSLFLTRMIEHSGLAFALLRYKFEVKPIRKIPLDIVCFVKENIDQGYYVTVTIKNLNSTSMEYHDYILIGYDDETQTIEAAGYFSDTYGKFPISYKQIKESLPKKINKIPTLWMVYKNNWFAMRLAVKYQSTRLSRMKIRLVLFLYAYGKTPFLYNTSAIRSFVKRRLLKQKIDLRGIKIIEEHMNGILGLLHLVNPDCPQTAAFQVLYGKMKITMMGLARIKWKKKYQKLESVANQLIKLSWEEQRILQQFYRNARKNHFL